MVERKEIRILIGYTRNLNTVNTKSLKGLWGKEKER
jgi:hypothetical protein